MISSKTILVAFSSRYISVSNHAVFDAFAQHPKVEMVDWRNLQGKKPDLVVFDMQHRTNELHTIVKQYSNAVSVLITGEALFMFPQVVDWSFAYAPTDKRALVN